MSGWIWFVCGGCLGIFIAAALLTWVFWMDLKEQEKKDYAPIFAEIKQIKAEISALEACDDSKKAM